MAYASKHNTTDEGIVPIGSNLYGTCSTGSATTAKVVSMSAFNVLTEGVTIHVYFQNGNTASAPTLKVGSTDAKQIWYNGAQGGNWESGAFVSFTYYNDHWIQNDVQEGGGGETYSLSISGHTITLTGDGGTTSSVTVPDEDTKYGLSISGHTISLVAGGSGTQVTVPDNNTTYTLGISGNTLTLTPSSGTAQSVTLPGTTYGIDANSGVISLVEGSDNVSNTYVGQVTQNGVTLPIGSTLYGKCEDTGDVVDKTATVDGFDTILLGVTIRVKFSHGNTASNPTLNVNGTGAYPIWRDGYGVDDLSDPARSWKDGAVVPLTFDGQKWKINTAPSISAGNGLEYVIPNTMQLVYSVGDVIITSTNTNPSATYGGTWTLIDKEFKSANGSTGATWNATNTQGTRNITWVRGGHSIYLRFTWANKVAFSDNNLTICTIDGSVLGISSAPYAHYFTGTCDGINAIIQMNLSWSGVTGTLQSTDVTTRATSIPSTTNQQAYAETVIILPYEEMDDDMCDKFYWKRTA